MPGTSISALSTQYVLGPVRAWVAGQLYNPTADIVQMAFVAGSAEPATGQWNTASWAWTTPVNGYYAVQCLVGPGTGGVVLAQGSYSVWVKIIDNPEIPVINTGTLTITP
jgi:hypothetical protein